MRRRPAARCTGRASAMMLGAWLLAATPAAAEPALPPELLLPVFGPPAVSAAPPGAAGRAARRATPTAHTRDDYYSRADREAEALYRKRKGKWRVFKHHIPLPASYEDEFDLYFRTPSKKAVKSRVLSAGFEIKF